MNIHDDSLDDVQGAMAWDVVTSPQQNFWHSWNP
jgi:hypothetical protein